MSRDTQKSGVPYHKWELKKRAGSQDSVLFILGGQYEVFILYGRCWLLRLFKKKRPLRALYDETLCTAYVRENFSDNRETDQLHSNNGQDS